MKNLIAVLMIAFQFSVALGNPASDSLRGKIADIINSKKADVGVAIYGFESGDTLTFSNTKHFPMQSVYKFHLAMAVLEQVDKGKFTLDQKIRITKKDLKPDTWSPMKDKYPNENIELPLSEILNYTISQSDNNGCDILFRLIGGTKKVHDYIKSIGIQDISIKATEEEMHKSWKVQFKNWSTPFASAMLLEKFFRGNIISKSSFDFLWKAMVNTSTGPNRIKGLLPKEAIVAHKTGTSGKSCKDISAAVNDIGIITLPNGQHFAIVVFVSNSKEEDETNKKIIAEISKTAWDYFAK